MSKRMSPQSLSLFELMTSRRHFSVPADQRAYGWCEDEIDRLFSDCMAAIQRRKSAAASRRLFLGTVYLSESGDSAEIADGQQRLVSISIIAAALRDLAPDEKERRRLASLLANDGDGGYRLRLRDHDAEFFIRWVQAPGAMLLAFAGDGVAADKSDAADARPVEDLDDLSESQRNILNNRAWIVEKLNLLGADARAALADFFAAGTEVIVIAAPTLEEARDAYASTHKRGLRLAEIDKLKVEILGDTRRQVRSRLAHVWEECEARTGKQGLEALLEHLVMIETQRKPENDIQGDLFHTFQLPRNSAKFIEDVLAPSARAFQQLTRRRLRDPGRFGSATAEGRRIRRINGHLVSLARVTHETWKPAAILALKQWCTDPAKLEIALKGLERMASAFMIVGRDPNQAIEAYGAVVGEFKRGIARSDGALALDAETRRTARQVLSLAKFGTKDRCRMAVLMKLNDLVAGEVVAIDPSHASCEHVLPQNPAADSPWRVLFRQTGGSAYAGHNYFQRIGNLLILTFDANQVADREPYAIKRAILAASDYAMTRTASEHMDWTPAIVETRSESLIKQLVEHWNL